MAGGNELLKKGRLLTFVDVPCFASTPLREPEEPPQDSIIELYNGDGGKVLEISVAADPAAPP
jgi:hypothetical protein